MRKIKLKSRKFYVSAVSLLIFSSILLSSCSLMDNKAINKAKAMETVNKLKLSKQDLKDEKIRQSLIDLGLTNEDIANLEKTLPDKQADSTSESTDSQTPNKGVASIESGSVTTEDKSDNSANVKTINAESKEEVYSCVKATLDKGEDAVSIKSKTIDKNTMENLAIDAVEYYGYGGYISEVSESVFLNNYRIHILYKAGKDSFKSQLSQVNDKVNKLIAELIKPGMNEFTKEKVLHDYVVNNTKYDEAAAVDIKGNPDAFTAYGVLINKKAVCEGYAEAMYRLLNAAGIENYLIKGQADGVLHEWNIVKISGKYYHLDATFDDPVADKDYLDYNYFNLSDKAISVNHSWEQQKYVKCQSMDANYFIYYGLYVNSTSSYKKLLTSQLESKVSPILIKTETYDEAKYNPEAVNDILVNNDKLYKIVNTKEGYRYSYDDKTNVMTINISYK